jgi:hypothetical protein
VTKPEDIISNDPGVASAPPAWHFRFINHARIGLTVSC